MRRISHLLLAIACAATMLAGCTDQDFEEVLTLLNAFYTGDEEDISQSIDLANADKAADLRKQALKNKDPDKQVDLLDQALKLQPNNLDLLTLKAAALTAGGQPVPPEIHMRIAALHKGPDTERDCSQGSECSRLLGEKLIDAMRTVLEQYTPGSDAYLRARAEYCGSMSSYSNSYPNNLNAAGYVDSWRIWDDCSNVKKPPA